MSNDVARLERLTTDLSQLSTAEEVAFDLRPEPLDLVALTQGVIRRVRQRYDERGVTVRLASGQPAPVIAASYRTGLRVVRSSRSPCSGLRGAAEVGAGVSGEGHVASVLCAK